MGIYNVMIEFSKKANTILVKKKEIEYRYLEGQDGQESLFIIGKNPDAVRKTIGHIQDMSREIQCFLCELEHGATEPCTKTECGFFREEAEA